MFRHSIRSLTALRPVARAGISAVQRPRWSALPVQARGYSSPTPVAREEQSPLSASSTSPAQKPPLPAAPKASTAPLVESDFADYLTPLYGNGWFFHVGLARNPAPPFLQRTFFFSSTEESLAFVGKLSKATGILHNVSVVPDHSARVELSSPEGVTRSVLRAALEVETEYQKTCPDTPAPAVPELFQLSSPSALQVYLDQKHGRTPSPSTPREPVALPSPPPAPAMPPPSVNENDVETYLKPLLLNEWHIGTSQKLRSKSETETGTGTSEMDICPALRRTYRFVDATSAKEFFHNIVIPALHKTPLAGANLKTTGKFTIDINSSSILAAPGPQGQKQGVSLVDVRFAIELEAEFNKNWAKQHSLPLVSSPGLPEDVKSVWDIKIVNAPRRSRRGSAKKEGDAA
ncbi:hypothetical protein B0H15DRAFT_505999 [Mycena belliarum]|uniref:Uncharacterized protein n=1 Tax=Mycena belliarum TaxID=1033014 RepID=A0AAD6UDZ3_9AGAR|nr:hypothetical protein B0H15DRAFT_505999 [Mycena belliae]